jgi:hypothetical protein
VYIYDEGRLLLVTTTVRQTCCVQPIPVPPFASTDWQSLLSVGLPLRVCIYTMRGGCFWSRQQYDRRVAYSPSPSHLLRAQTDLSASTAYDYIEHTHEIPRMNGATDALSIGPSAGYNLFFVFVHILLLFTV